MSDLEQGEIQSRRDSKFYRRRIAPTRPNPARSTRTQAPEIDQRPGPDSAKRQSEPRAPRPIGTSRI